MIDDDLRERVATACRVIALEGFLDLTLGHVSARNPGDRTVWIKRKGVALDEVEPSDVILLDIDDESALENGEYHFESVMHTEIYRARPDVGSVIHGHPLYATALGSTDGRLDFLTHDAVLFADGIGDYDDGPDLITTNEQGRRVAEALGSRRAALLRNHGVVIAGEDIRWSVLAAVTLERAIRFQVVAAPLGNPRPISDAEAKRLFPLKYQDGLVDEYWAAWERRVHAAGASARAVSR
ncbi:MAG: class II aldolase/adducin family protein [Candidatus Limnocylindrales bacterium]